LFLPIFLSAELIHRIYAFLTKFTQNGRGSTRTPQGELKRSPRSLADFRGATLQQGKGKGGERGRRRGGETGRGLLGKGKREGNVKEEGKGGEEGVCIIGVGGDRHP